tara:strand:+ start:596 stop:940 length:345 start_codon:yes stop_codon:yes gene_type:complete
MSHFAQINQNNIVTQVIVAEQDFIDSGVVGDPSTWIQTSYNTFGGQHRLKGTPLRKNYAGIGYLYDSELDAFIAPKPYESWILNSDTCLWEAPVVKPDGYYYWNEEELNWIEIK